MISLMILWKNWSVSFLSFIPVICVFIVFHIAPAFMIKCEFT